MQTSLLAGPRCVVSRRFTGIIGRTESTTEPFERRADQALGLGGRREAELTGDLLEGSAVEPELQRATLLGRKVRGREPEHLRACAVARHRRPFAQPVAAWQVIVLHPARRVRVALRLPAPAEVLAVGTDVVDGDR